ncbi:hypothetical protein [Coleofasciculus sp. G2-EDA-02]|uniref:hypothetical protein n=1 Tax=Coleofasciculus sp. G2-EDA-02 TaxID=3069529 RepID=UPI0032F99E86
MSVSQTTSTRQSRKNGQHPQGKPRAFMYCPQRNFLRLFVTAVISLLAVSCGQSKVSQCNQMIQVANQAVSDAKVVTNGVQEDNPQAEAMRQAAAVMDKASTEMNAIDVTDETLQDYQTSFSNMYRDTSQAMRDFAVAFEQKDRQAAEAAQMNLQQATTPEKQLVDNLNAYCSGD